MADWLRRWDYDSDFEIFDDLTPSDVITASPMRTLLQAQYPYFEVEVGGHHSVPVTFAKKIAPMQGRQSKPQLFSNEIQFHLCQNKNKKTSNAHLSH